MTDDGMNVSTSDSSCDLCNRVMATSVLARIPLKDMQRAARKGFNPYKLPDMQMPTPQVLSAKLKPSDEQLFQLWRQKVLEDTTDWRLCPDCAQAFFKHAEAAAQQEAEPRHERLNTLAKKARILVSPAGALLALICFFLPWGHVTCAGTYSASDSQLGGILWLTFLAALAILGFSAMAIWSKSSEEAPSRWNNQHWKVGLVLLAMTVLSVGLVAGLGELGIWGAWVGVLLSIILIVALARWAKLKATSSFMVAISALVGLLAIIMKWVQLVHGKYIILGETFTYDYLMDHGAHARVLYGAYLTVAGLLIALVGSVFLYQHVWGGTDQVKSRPTVKEKSKSSKPKKPKEKKKTLWDRMPPGSETSSHEN